MRHARLAAVLAAALIALAAGASTALGAGWAKLSGDDVSSIDQAAVVANGPQVVAAWPSGTGSDLATSIAFRGFAPTATASLAGATPIATAASGYTNVSQRPGLVILPSGLRAITSGTIAGNDQTYLSAPLTAGQSAAAPPTPIAVQLGGALDAVTTADGGLIVANMENGALHTFRDTVPADGPDIQALLGGGCCSYHPALGRDASGRIWIVWYSNATGHVGLYIAQLDPATAAPVGGALKVPQSESPANNGFHPALACAAVCRIVYAAQTTAIAPLRPASWTPGQAAPTIVAANVSLSLGPSLTAAFRSDGRLWVAWFNSAATTTTGGYQAKLGTATGAGGTIENLGKPPGLLDARDLESVALGKDLVLVGTVVTARPRSSLWTTLAQDPSQVIENPRTIRNGPAKVVAPKGVSLKNLKKGKCVRVRVSVTDPARVLVAIFSGPKSRRLFGQKILAFTKAPATRITCVKVPFRAKTFDPRAPAGIIVAVRKGSARGSSGPPAKVVTKGFRFF